MTVAQHIETIMAKSSWIRKMFEEGARLKSEHGAERVYDFSLGNPNLEPPAIFERALQDLVAGPVPVDHGYMPNTGYAHVRQAVADFLVQELQVPFTGDEIIMTCGAAGALNVIFKALLDPGDEVLTPAPCFVEYGFYAGNHGGILKMVPTRSDFTLDLDALAEAISPRTKIVLVNSPNNPTGQIYSADSLQALGTLLKAKSQSMGRTIYLVSDEPYRKIVYDGAEVPSIFHCYPESVMATSYSKDISIAGERIGYLAVSPQARYKQILLGGMALANRILGFVNAPALMQRVIATIQGAEVNVAAYARKRDLLCDGLAACGYEFVRPPGALYLFPRTPVADDVQFVRELQKELILAVPGSGFGGPGHFRIAFCVEDQTIVDALPGFGRVMERFK